MLGWFESCWCSLHAESGSLSSAGSSRCAETSMRRCDRVGDHGLCRPLPFPARPISEISSYRSAGRNRKLRGQGRMRPHVRHVPLWPAHPTRNGSGTDAVFSGPSRTLWLVASEVTARAAIGRCSCLRRSTCLTIAPVSHAKACFHTRAPDGRRHPVRCSSPRIRSETSDATQRAR